MESLKEESLKQEDMIRFVLHKCPSPCQVGWVKGRDGRPEAQEEARKKQGERGQGWTKAGP